MAASALVRLFVVVMILIALALSSGVAWGSLSTLDDTEDYRVPIQSIEAPEWLDNLP